jgi:hypothetical protein
MKETPPPLCQGMQYGAPRIHCPPHSCMNSPLLNGTPQSFESPLRPADTLITHALVAETCSDQWYATLGRDRRVAPPGGTEGLDFS